MTNARHYQFEDFLLDAEEGILYRNGQPIPLTRKVFDLLLLFVRSNGRVLTHAEIIQTVWADTSVEQANLKQSIYVLRRALGELPDENRFIKTLPKRGYRFLPEVCLPFQAKPTLVAEQTITEFLIEEEIFDDEADERILKRLPPAGDSRPIWQQAWFITLLVVACVAAGGVGLYRYARSDRRTVPPISLENASWQKLTSTGNVHYAFISPNGEFVAYIGLEKTGEQSIRLLNIGNRSELTLVPPAQIAIWGVTFSPDSRQIYYTAWDRNGEAKAASLYAVSVLGGTARKILEPLNSPIGFTPDGSRLVYTRHAEDLKTLCLVTANAVDGSDQQIIGATQKVEFIAPSFSPDGQRVLYVGADVREDGWFWFLAERPAAGGEPRIITEPRKGRFFGATWYPDGNGILLNAVAPDSKQQQLWFVSYPQGEISRITNDLIGYTSLGVSADGKKIVSNQLTRTNSIWSVSLDGSGSTGSPRRLTEDTLLIQSAAWTSDHRIVYDSTDNGRKHLWLMNSDGADKHQLSPENFEDWLPAVSPDGRFLIFLSNRSGTWQLWRTRADGSEPKQLTFGKDSPALAKFAFGGDKIIIEHFIENDWRLVEMSVEGGEMRPLNGVAPELWNVSPDGKTIAYSFGDKDKNQKKVAVQSLEDKSKIVYLDLAPRDFLVFSRDGRSLLTKPPLATANSDSSIYSFPITGGEPQKLVLNPPENFYWADLSPDGKQLVWVQGRLVSNVVLLTQKD
jgi:Tol biopolymer transport system component/DNA-binding winged helix-turn-helix (wHTH) protein